MYWFLSYYTKYNFDARFSQINGRFNDFGIEQELLYKLISFNKNSMPRSSFRPQWRNLLPQFKDFSIRCASVEMTIRQFLPHNSFVYQTQISRH